MVVVPWNCVQHLILLGDYLLVGAFPSLSHSQDLDKVYVTEQTRARLQYVLLPCVLHICGQLRLLVLERLLLGTKFLNMIQKTAGAHYHVCVGRNGS